MSSTSCWGVPSDWIVRGPISSSMWFMIVACVDCGSDSVATCQRCRHRKCAAHYLVSVSVMLDRTLAATQSSGNVVTLNPPASWSRNARFAYARGSAGCMACRSAAAERANQSVLDDFDTLCAQVVKAPSAARFVDVCDAIGSGDPLPDVSGRITEALAKAFRLVISMHEIVETNTLVTGTFRKVVRVDVTSRIPALYFQGVRPSGIITPHWALTANGQIYEGRGRDSQCNMHLVPKHGTPSFEYFKGTSYSGYVAEAGPVLDTRSERSGIEAVEHIHPSHLWEAVRDLANSGRLR